MGPTETKLNGVEAAGGANIEAANPVFKLLRNRRTRSLREYSHVCAGNKKNLNNADARTRHLVA